MRLIDTQVHINYDVFESDLEDIKTRWQQAEVVHLVHSCVEPDEFQSIKTLADRFGNLSFAVGLHPLDADKWTNSTETEIFNYAKSDHRVVAIGEMGLDFHKANNQQQQQEVLEAQLKIAHKLQKPVIIHCRDAAQKLKDVLELFWQESGQIKGVMHCWSGTPEETQWFLDLGFYISFSGVVTFKNAKTIQESAKIVPSDRLLIETDCPFLAPVPKRGKRNEPANVRHVAEFLAKLRDVPLETLAQKTTHNACQLFNLSLDS